MGRIDAQEFLNRQRRDFPACECNALRTKVAELEAALRPAAGLPTWRELVERVFLGIKDHENGLFYSGMIRKDTLWGVVKSRFGLGSTYSQQLCAALGRDPETGEKRGEE